MIAWVPLAAADLEPYLKLIGLIVAVSIMAINHLLAGLKKARAQLPPPPEASPPRDPIAAASTRQDLNAEVKEFLRRAAHQRGGAERGSQAPSRQPTPRPSMSPASANRNEGQRKQKRKSQQPKPIVPVVPKLDDSIANRRMTSRLESTRLDDRTEQLSGLGKLNEIDANAQQSVEHQVGQLTSGQASLTTTSATSNSAAGDADSQANSAADIAELLRNPQSLRTAIILNEILARPVDRW